jgi:hypothetical protein
MKRWHLFSPVLFAALFAVVLAVLPIGSNRNNDEVFAHVITGTPGVNLPHLELDMLPDGVNTWCSPVDPVANHLQDDDYEVAVCLSGVPSAAVPPDAGGPPSALQFTLKFDPTLNKCVPTACGDLDPNCLDSNPDANARVTGGTIFNGTGLGTKWNCNISDVQPSCNNTTGEAFLQCNMTSGTGTLTLPVGPDVSWPIAVVSFTALHGGRDDLTLVNSEADDASLASYVKCFGSPCLAGAVFGGTDNKSGSEAPTATPTFTPAPPTATPAYCGNPGQPQCTPTPRAFTQTPSPGPTATATAAAPPPPPPPPPPSGGPGPVVSPPSTGDGPSDLSWSTPLAAAIAAIGAVSLVSGGLYVRYARKR